MPSLQLFQLTEKGRQFGSSRRRALAVATAVFITGGAAAYLHSQRYKGLPGGRFRRKKEDDTTAGKPNVVTNGLNHGKLQKRSGLKSLQILARILLSRVREKGIQNLLSLVAIAVLRTATGNRLAKVQGFLFQAAFLGHLPSFIRLIAENLLLCFLQSALFSTSKYLTGVLGLRFRRILTELIHADYFQNMTYYKMSHVDGRISNPEQRIASDIPRFCSELSELVQEDSMAVADALLYTWRLCSYASPKYFFWIMVTMLFFIFLNEDPVLLSVEHHTNSR